MIMKLAGYPEPMRMSPIAALEQGRALLLIGLWGQGDGANGPPDPDHECVSTACDEQDGARQYLIGCLPDEWREKHTGPYSVLYIWNDMPERKPWEVIELYDNALRAARLIEHGPREGDG